MRETNDARKAAENLSVVPEAEDAGKASAVPRKKDDGTSAGPKATRRRRAKTAAGEGQSSQRASASAVKKSNSGQPMRILMAGSEALPFAASGGLGDVLGSLPIALKDGMGDGADVRVVIPLYAQIKAEWREKMSFLRSFTVRLAWRQQYCGIFTLERDGVIWYFIDNEYYFRRGGLYGQFDDGERYAFFSMAVMEMMRELDWFPDILHAHDWQSALTVIYLKRCYADDPRYAAVRSVYTIHNIEYQGRYEFAILGDVFALSADDRVIVEYDGQINLTKGAIVCCDRLTTVSRRYAEELRDPYFAHGLAHITRRYAEKTVGIVNGIDIDYYNPAAEADLNYPFSADRPAGKAANKAELQRGLGLEISPDTPLMAMITRLAAHKGLDLVRHVIDELMAERRMQFVLLGTGEPEYEAFFAEFAARWPGRAAVIIDFNKPLSKRIYAGADLFLMPSRSEPCGLAQMIACRYGTLPIVRETGGLFDTIVPANPMRAEGNGVTFVTYNAHDMKDAVERALGYYADRALWTQLVHNAMTADFSWGASAGHYVELYRALL